MSTGLRNSIRTKQKLYKQYLKRPITFNDRYKKYRNSLNNLIKAAKNSFYNSKLTVAQGNAKATWKVINNILGNTHKDISDTFTINNRTTSNKKDIADAFNNYYTSEF